MQATIALVPATTAKEPVAFNAEEPVAVTAEEPALALRNAAVLPRKMRGELETCDYVSDLIGEQEGIYKCRVTGNDLTRSSSCSTVGNDLSC